MYELYPIIDRDKESQYPSWKDASPNLFTFLDAINKSSPIVAAQYEMVWSRWPRTIFFVDGISIPGISVQVQSLNHMGFEVKIPTHVKYDTTEIQFNILADKEGYHYYDIRNMVIQTGHPLVAGDPKATIGNPYGISPSEDTIDVKLRNKPDDYAYHHWLFHNFHPIEVGELELGNDSAQFVKFQVKGTFTHITYVSGESIQTNISSDEQESNVQTNDNSQDGEQQQNSQSGDNNQSSGGSDDDTSDEPEDLTPDPPPNNNEDVMSGLRQIISNGNCKIYVSITSDVAFVRGTDGAEVTQEELDDAKECSKQMTEAANELKQELAEISKLPADANFNPEDGDVKDIKLNKTKTPSKEQSESGDEKPDKVSSLVQTDCKFKSQEQVDRYNAAMDKYNSKVNQAQQEYKSKKQSREENRF